MRSRNHRLPLITTAAALMLAACGDDGPTATATDATTTTTTTDDDGSTALTTDASTGPDAGTTADASTGPADTTDASTGPGDTTDAEASTTDPAGLEIAGEWLEEFSPGEGITHVIDSTTWQQLAEFGDALFHVESYDNDARTVVAQGDAANEFFPELYSRFDWTWDGDALYYCTAVFDAATPEEALAAPQSDPGDLAMGCGGFPWSPLQPIR